MSKLQAALEWARRGYRVFPLRENGKTPAFKGSWIDWATSDETRVRQLWTREYNIGVDCTGFVVVDIDVKNGKNGINEYASFGGHYETLVVATPSGGYHCYFSGPNSGNASISKGVDIRSNHGYVVAPGSTIDGAPYQIITDIAPANVPATISPLLSLPYQRAEHDAPSIDSPAMINGAMNFLETTPVAVEGQGGDLVTFQTAARLVREMALSVDVAYDLIREHWNDRCEPPWDLDELYLKVENASRYGSADHGRLDPSVTFANINIEPPPSMFEASVFGNAIDPTQVVPRPWLVDRVLMAREVTLLIAQGSAGKSTWALALAAHMALGVDFGPYKMHVRSKSVIYNGEDDRMEMSRRLIAICQSCMLDYSEVKKHIMLLSEEDVQLKIAIANGRTAVAVEAAITDLVELTSNPEVGMLVLDPLGDIHGVDETDNPAMNTVMSIVKRVSREANIATLVLHHSSKGGGRQEDRVGNMDIARGASAIVNKARISFTMFNATQSDAEKYGLRDEDRNKYVRLDDAKMNLTLAGRDATWYVKEGVRIVSGDIVGVLNAVNMEANVNALRNRIGDLLISTMTSNSTGSMAIAQAVAVLKHGEPLWAGKTDKDVRDRVESMFISPVQIGGRTLQVTRETQGTKHVVTVVLI